MTFTVQNVIANAHKVFRGSTPDQILQHLRSFHSRLWMDWCYEKSTYTINTVADQKDYTLPASVSMVLGVEYYSSATAHVTLRPFSAQERDKLDPGWRLRQTSSSPNDYALEGRKLFVLPAPANTTGVSGYPRLLLDTWTIPDIDQSSDLPEHPNMFDVYLYGTLASLAPIEAPGDINVQENYKRLCDEAQIDFDRYYTRRPQGSQITIYAR